MREMVSDKESGLIISIKSWNDFFGIFFYIFGVSPFVFFETGTEFAMR